jgi:hypothetical protein
MNGITPRMNEQNKANIGNPTNNCPILALMTPPRAPDRPPCSNAPHPPSPSPQNCRYSGSSAVVAGSFGTPLVVQRAWTSSAGHCAPRTRAAPCAVGAQRVALSDTRSGWSRLRTGRCCSCPEAAGGGGGSLCFPFPAAPARFCFSAFSATARLTGLSVIPVEKLTHQSMTGGRTLHASEGIRQPHQ